MAGNEPINDTTLEVLQTVDLWNSALMQILFETVIKSGMADADDLIAKVSAMGARLQGHAQMPAAAAHIEHRARTLTEDIRIWEQQGRGGG